MTLVERLREMALGQNTTMEEAQTLFKAIATLRAQQAEIERIDGIIGDHTISSPDALEQIRKIVVFALANAKAARP